MKRLIDICYNRACELLTDNRDKLTAVAESLLDRDTLNRAEFEMVMRGEELPPKTEAEQVTPSEDAEADLTPEKEEDGAESTAFAMEDEETANDEEAFVEPEDENE